MNMRTTEMVTGDELRGLRGYAGISLKSMSDTLGCTPEHLAYVELGERPVELALAVAVVRAVIDRMALP